MPVEIVLIAALAVALLAALLGWWRSIGRAGRRSRRRNATAQAGEADAEALLEAHGYTVLARQEVRGATLWVDDEPVDYEVRADLLVERDGSRWVAEVKTGRLAPDPRHPPTRRQLREYGALFPDCGLLLVEMDEEAVFEVSFEDPEPP